MKKQPFIFIVYLMNHVEGDNLVFQWTFSVKHKFFHVSIVNTSEICCKINYRIVCVLIFLFVSNPKTLCRKSVEKLSYLIWKQPPRGVLMKKCSENMQQIYRRTPMLRCDFNEVEIALRHGCSPVNLLHIFRAPFPRKTSGWLLLLILSITVNPNFT